MNPEYEKIKQELNIDNKDVSKIFGLNYASFIASSARKRYEESFCRMYKLINSKKTTNFDKSYHTF